MRRILPCSSQGRVFQVVELLKRLISYSLKRVPSFQKRFWAQFYNFVARAIRHDDFVYMNLGYADLDGRTSAIRLEEPGQLHHLSDQLYQHVAGAVDLGGQEVLEIGCGRGGGSSYLMQHLKPKTLTAVDISHVTIERCKQTHKISGLSFMRANAESLQFADSTFDAVVCIESSHCYLSRARFLAEVARVLRPKGYFLYADLLNPVFDSISIETLNGLLSNCGLHVLKAENISANVLRAREILSESSLYKDCITRWTGSRGKRNKVMSSIFCLKGTSSYRRLSAGEMQYWCWVMQKPQKEGPPWA